MVIINNNGKIVLINQQTEKIFGFSQEELFGEPIEILLPERLRERHIRHRVNYLKEPNVRPMGTHLNILGTRKDGSEVPLDISLSPWRNGDEFLVISTIRDITERMRTEEELKWKNQNLEILNTITNAVYKSHDLEEIYNIALDMAMVLDNVDLAEIYLVDKDRKEAILQAHRNFPEEYIRRARRIPYPKGGTWKVINTRTTINIENIQKDPDIGPAGRDLGHHGAVGIPITSEEDVIGVIWFLSYKERRFEEEEVVLLTTIGNQIATAIAKAKLYRDLERKTKYEGIIRTVTQNVHNTIDLQEVLDNAAGSLIDNIDVVDNVGIYMVEGEVAVLKAHRGLTNSFIKRAARIPYPRGFTWNTITEGKPRYCADTDKDQYIGPAGRQEGIKSYLSMPITHEGKTIGCINITSQQKNALDKEEIMLLEILSDKVSIATKNAQQADELKFTQFSVDRCGDAIFWISPDARILYVNDAACKLDGYSREEFLSMSIYDVDPTYTEEIWPETWETFKQCGTLTFETHSRRKDGRILPIEVTANYLYFKGKEYVCAFVRDITARKLMEENLIKVQKLESVGMLAGGIAHDFNNLLTVIMGNISLARLRTEENSTMFEILDEAEKATLGATNLTKQLLTFSKGGDPVKKLSSILEIIKESTGLALRGSNVRCEYSIPPDLWSAVVDKGQISQVINNLVINAKEAMMEGGVVQVSAKNIIIGKEHNTLKEGKWVRIMVTDFGKGIPHEDLKKIFDPYFTTKENRSGLGLAICYSIISKHGGLITADSEPGAGTTFTIYLPSTGEVYRNHREAARQSVLQGGKGRVLVMDDEAIIRITVALILEEAGYKVFEAADGAEALQLYENALREENPFDAVILDLTIPGGMGGKETMEKLMQIDPNVKAIVSSGYSNDPVMADFENYGFKAIVAKPYSAEELSQVVQTVIHAEQQEDL